MAFILPISFYTAIDNSGLIAAGAKLRIFDAGTTNPKVTYSDNGLTTPTTLVGGAVVADGAGRFPTLFVPDGSQSKTVVKDSGESITFRTDDFIIAPTSSSLSSVQQGYSTQSSSFSLTSAMNGTLIGIDASGGDVIVTADSATLGNGFHIILRKINATVGNAVLTPVGFPTQSFDGAASYTIDTQYEDAHISSIGAAGWAVTTRSSVEPVGELPGLNEQVGTTYTLALADKGKKVRLTNGSAITLTVPTNAVVAFPLLTRIELTQGGAGIVTIAGAGVTFESLNSWLRLFGQHCGVILTKRLVNTWLVEGSVQL